MDKKNIYNSAILEKLIIAHEANKIVILQTDQENRVSGMFTPYKDNMAPVPQCTAKNTPTTFYN